MDLPANESTKERGERACERTNERRNERTNERTSERASERMNKRKNDIIKAFVWKRTTKYVEKVQRKSAETAISSIFPVEKIFSRKSDLAMFWALLKHIFEKKIKKLMTKSWGNAKKLVFPVYLAETHFRHYRFPSVCKFSWKNIKYKSRNSRNTFCSGDF